MIRCITRLGLAAILGLVCVSAAQAASDVWDGSGLIPPSGVWGTGSNWVDNTTPGNSDTATFNLAPAYTVTFGAAPAAIQNLTVAAGAVTFTSSGGPKTLSINSGGGQDLLVTGGLLTLGTSGNPLNVTIGDDLQIHGGGFMAANFGSDISTVDVILGDSTAPSGGGVLFVDGVGSSLAVSGSTQLGSGGQSGVLTIRNGATANFNDVLGLADTSSSPSNAGTVSVESGASITTRDIRIAPNAISGQTGTFVVGSVTGTATVTQNDLATLIVGAALGGPTPNSGTLNINSGGVFNSGTGGTITIKPTGTVNIAAGGTLNASSDVMIDGVLSCESGSTFTLSSFNKTMDVGSGGRASFAGGYSTADNAHYSIYGDGATLEITNNNNLLIGSGAQVNVGDGGTVSSANLIVIAQGGYGTLSVDGTGGGASAVASASGTNRWGTFGGTATVTFSHGATGTFNGGIDLASTGTANVTVESGADLTTGNLSLYGESTFYTATLTVDGAGSTVTLNPNKSLTVSYSNLFDNDNAVVNVLNDASVTVGAGGSTTLNAGGTININGGAVDLKTVTANGGIVNLTAGSLSFNGNLTAGLNGLLGGNPNLGTNQTVTLTGTTTVNSGHALTLSGGTLNTATLVNNGTFNFMAGTLGINQVGATINTPFVTGPNTTININANNITLGSAASFAGFSHQGTLNVGANTVTLNSAGYARLGVLTSLNGGTINAPNGVTFSSGSNLLGHGTVNARVAGELGSVIEADNTLALGDATSPAGFNFAGELRTKQFAVTLNSSAAVGLGNLTTLGSGASPGTLGATNGFVVDFDEAVTGYGTINSTNTLAKRATINGTVQGNSAGQPITLSGYIKGTGTFTNVIFTGTYSPGLSPTISTVGSITLGPASTLIMELGGTAAGSGYDQIQASGTLTLGGTLDVALLNGFNPALGNTFNILDWSSLSGTFATLQLPTLASGLSWNTSQLYSSGVLSVGLAGDFNSNGVVDAADYVWWRKNSGLASGYNLWRSNFGAPGSGSGSASTAHAAVPEPGAILLGLMACAATAPCGRRRRQNDDRENWRATSR